jgi:nitrate reductase (NAD(P)H)
MSKKHRPKCEELYGPYPSALPIPFLNSSNEGRQGEIPPSSVLESAKSMFDLPCDYRDAGCPDQWITRDGRLVRLTGKHPFNCEPPTRLLHQFGFITPSSLHYVRNHGACPKLTWEEHTVTVEGSGVPNPHEFSMDELVNMPRQRELPVTLVCAGNRRKEQNMIRQTIGFNWGSSGVSTNVWKGVLLRDLLLECGVTDDFEDMEDWHVEMVGVEDLPNKVGPGPFSEEPWGKLVKYGTSIPLARAMNPAYDVLVAYEANGQRLQPDHGFPVRIIIPGYIGGRMIKWLHKIRVLPHESKNHYHYHDNRILPPQITAEESLAGNWWYKPEYIFNELNINSSITKPDHNETLDLVKHIAGTYDIAGYAYTGGGRKITRVEISIDHGVHWELATIRRDEKPTSHGMYWCWTWWSYAIPVAHLIGSSGEIWCRAWDEGNNVQPTQPTWNLMGMGNNQAFRVKIHCDKVGNAHCLRFEHPTQPGQQTGGWMTRTADKPESAGFGKLLAVQGESTAATSTVSTEKKSGESSRLITMDEIQQHNTEKDCWIIVKDRVYDCSEYLELHPVSSNVSFSKNKRITYIVSTHFFYWIILFVLSQGGVESIVINGGMDATEDFVAIHSIKATKMLEKYYIGDLDKASAAASKSNQKPEEEQELVDEQGRKLALHPRRKISLKLQNKIVLSRDSFLLDFALPTQSHILGLPTGKHVFMSAKINDEPVLRRYTPISSNYDVGCVKFVIKAYRACERFPEGGKMSQYVDTLQVGDTLDFKGPVGEFEYLQDGKFLLEGHDGECRARCFNMIAGGTGITPCMQIAAEILRNANHDRTRISLIFACRVEGDLLMRSTLEEWAAAYPDQFHVHYILSDEWPSDWKYSTGFVDKALFQEHLYAAAEDVYNLMCGPPIMLDKGCTPNLQALGHAKSRIFSF